jgi:hypothetical protein
MMHAACGEVIDGSPGICNGFFLTVNGGKGSPPDFSLICSCRP